MEKKGLLFLALLSYFVVVVVTGVPYEKNRFAQRTNIIFVVDVKRSHSKDILKHVWILLDGISLRKYRIGLYSTNGVSQKLINYQSRQCTVNKLRSKRPRFKRLSVILKAATKEVIHQFKKDENIFVVLTDQPVDDYAKHVLNFLKLRANKVEDYIIQMERQEDAAPKSFSLTKTNAKVLIEDLDSFSQVFSLLPFYKDTINSCKPTQDVVVYDECRRECECVDGRLVNCARIRSQFSELPFQSRVDYINAYKILATDPRYKQAFYNHIKIHPTVDFDVLHSKGQLLPFHRKYTLVFENFLRLIDCRLTIPFWNFALNAKHLFKRAPGYHLWDKVGGFGSPHTIVDNGFCVETGPFKYPQWQLPRSFVGKIDEKKRLKNDCEVTYQFNKRKEAYCKARLSETFEPRCMTRLLTGLYRTPTYKHVYKILHSDKTTFTKFEHFLRVSCHAAIHDDMGGDFGYGFSSILPEFFPLHSMLDAMWDYWEHKGPGKRYIAHWKNDKKFKIIGFHTPRYWYLDNNNLELCGVKIKYTNIFPKDIAVSKESTTKEGEDFTFEDVLSIEEEEDAVTEVEDEDEGDFAAWYFLGGL